MTFGTAAAYPAVRCNAPPCGNARAEVGKLRLALAIGQQRLDAAQAHIERLLTSNRQHVERAAALVQAVVKAERLAHRDELTGLPNRRLLMERFHQAVAQADRQQQQIALLFMDIDGFKRINDRFGHAAGDSLLQQVAARLTESIRSSDTACRYGGDEFIILLPAIEDVHSVTAVAEKIRTVLAAQYTVAGTAIDVHTSIGTAIFPANGQTYFDLIEASDRAMYDDKSGGTLAGNHVGTLAYRQGSPPGALSLD